MTPTLASKLLIKPSFSAECLFAESRALLNTEVFAKGGDPIFPDEKEWTLKPKISNEIIAEITCSRCSLIFFVNPKEFSGSGVRSICSYCFGDAISFGKR